MTQINPQDQEQVVNSLDVANPVEKSLDSVVPDKWHVRHARKIKIGAILGFLTVMLYTLVAGFLNLGYIGADSIVQGSNPGDIIGTIYTDEAQSINIGANKTVALSINGGAKTTVETDSSGVFTFTGQTYGPDDIVTVFLDDETEKSTIVGIAGNAILDGIIMVTNNVKLSHWNEPAMSNVKLDIADNCGDSDMKFSVSGGTATFAEGMKLWVRSLKTYRPGGAVIADNVRVVGTLSLEANTLTMTGDLANSGSITGSGDITISGGEASGNGTITMTGGTFLLDGEGNFGGSGEWSFNNLTFGDGSGASATTNTGPGAVSVSEVLSIAANQTLNAGSSIWTLAKTGTPFVKTGTFNSDTSTIKYTGGTSAVSMENTTYYNLTVDHADTNFQQQDATRVNNILTIANGTYVPSNNVSLYGTGTPLVNNGTLSTNGGVIYNGNGAVNVTGGTYGYVYFGYDDTVLTDNRTYTLLGDITIVTQSGIGATSGEFTATLAAGSYTIIVQNSGINIFNARSKGAFDAGTSTVRYTNAGGATSTGIGSYHNLELTPSADATYSFPASTTISGTFTNGNGTNTVATTILAGGSPDLGTLVNPANATLNVSNAGLSFSGSLANSATINLSGSTTVAFTATSSGKTIDTGGTSLPATTFNGSGGEWTLESSLTASSLTVTAGKLIDNGQAVSVGGDISIASTNDSLVSTGVWTLTANANITNPGLDESAPPVSDEIVYNSIYDFQIAAGVTATRTGHFNVRNLTMGADSAIGSSSTSNYFRVFRPYQNNFVSTSGSYTISGGAGFEIYPQTGTTRQQGALTIGEYLLVAYQSSATLQMTGDFTVTGNLMVAGDYWSTTEATAMVLDTNGKNLNVSGTLIVGDSVRNYEGKMFGKVKFSTGTHYLGGLFTENINTSGPQTGGYSHGYYDFGSSRVHISSNMILNSYSSVSGTNTGTIILDGSSQQTIQNTIRLYNLTVTNSSSEGVVFADSQYLDGTFTITVASGKLTFKSGSIYYFPFININGGSSSTPISMLSSVSGSKWYFTVVSAAPSVSYVSVRDSSAVAGSEINATTGGVDLGGNVNWNFGAVEPASTSTPIATPTSTNTPEQTATATAASTSTSQASSESTTSESESSTLTITKTATLTPVISATASVKSTVKAFTPQVINLLNDPDVLSGNSIVLAVSGRQVKLTEDDEARFHDSTPEFQGITQPNASIEALITGPKTIYEQTSADQVGRWFIKVSKRLPQGKYLLNLSFKDNGKVLGAKSYRFEITRNYWMDALYIGLLVSILIALITLIKKTGRKAKAKNPGYSV